MEEWKTYKIRDISVVNLSQYSLKEDWKEVSYLDTGSITENRIEGIQKFNLPCDDFPSRARRKVQNGDILFSTVRPNQKHYGILKNPASNLLVSTGFAVITVNTSIADPYYVYYYLTQGDLINYLQGVAEQSVSAYPSLRAADIEDLGIDLPSLAEQKRIANVLCSIDDKISINSRINHNLEEQAQALYKSWFVDFEPFKGGEFVRSELGMIPKDWKVLRFNEFATLSNERVNSESIPEFSVTNNGIFPRDAKFNKQLSSSSLKNKIVRKGDLVFGMSRDILNWGVMDDLVGGVSSAYTIYRVNSSMMDGLYLKNFMNQHLSYFKDLIRPAAREGQSIDKGVLATKIVYRPSDTIWSSFLSIYLRIIDQEKLLRDETQKLIAFRDTILPELMEGRISISETC